MLVISFILFTCSYAAVANVSLQVPSTATVNTSVSINWTRERGDPKVWDLRLLNTTTQEDSGLSPLNQTIAKHKNGSQNVIFPEIGQFKLLAVSETDEKGKFETIGTSHAFTVELPNHSTTTSTIPSSTALPNPLQSNPATSPTMTPVSQAIHPNTKAIIGGTFGGLVVLVILLALIAFFVRRRRKSADRRYTFDRDRMVQRRRNAPSIPPLTYIDIEATAGVQEHASRVGSTNLTTRQLDIQIRIVQLKAEILELESHATVTRLERMRIQVEWLYALQHSPWALGLTDERPSNYDLYMPS